MTGHGFRGLASTILHERGYVHEHIELQLAHAPRNAVSASYNHALYLKPRAKMMQDWADFLERTQRGSKVLPFRGTAACARPPARGAGWFWYWPRERKIRRTKAFRTSGR